MVKGILLMTLTGYLFYDHWAACFLGIPGLFFYMKSWRKERLKKKEAEFREQFRESIQMMSAALNVGYSVENAIRETWKDLRLLYGKKARILKEYEKMIHQLEVNMTAEEVMKQFADRVQSEDVENFVTVFAAAKRLGGDSIAIIRHAAETIGEKIEVEREIQTILASKKLEFKIMCAIPFVIILYMRSSFPEFMEVLYRNVAGAVFMTICLGVYLMAYRIGKKMTQIEV